MASDLTDIDYAALAEFRFALRRFQMFSETKAGEAGLTPQQHQALLAIRAADPDAATVGYVAQRLIVKPHTASELIDRLEAIDLVRREPAPSDRRRSEEHTSALQSLMRISYAVFCLNTQKTTHACIE